MDGSVLIGSVMIMLRLTCYASKTRGQDTSTMLYVDGIYLIHIVLAAVASLAWAACLLTAVGRYRAFRQRADLWWTLAFLCLAGVGIARLWEVWWVYFALMQQQEVTPASQGLSYVVRMMWVLQIPAYVAFTAASLFATVAYRRRRDAYDD